MIFVRVKIFLPFWKEYNVGNFKILIPITLLWNIIGKVC